MNQILLGDCLDVLPTQPESCATLAIVDPPFNTGRIQQRDRVKTSQTSGSGDRTGFGGKRYVSERLESGSYEDSFEDYEGFLMPRIEASLRCLAENGSIFVWLDWREVHYIKCAMDRLMGRDRFMREIIWSFDYGGRSKDKWPAKHNNILWYAKNPENYIFNYDAIDRIPYLAPDLVGPEKAALGKVPTCVWTNTIVPTNSKEKEAGGRYPTQKPLAILNRIVRVHSNPGDTVLDFFAGSGSSGAAAQNNGRDFILIDENPEAVAIMRRRLGCDRAVPD